MNEHTVSVLCRQFSSTRWLLIAVVIAFILAIIAATVLILLISLRPCLFTKCHAKASQCINRWPFKAQCICDAGRVGNGRTVCDECGVKYDPPNARIIGGGAALPHSWPFNVLVRQHYQNLVPVGGRPYLISPSWICGGTLINHRTILTAGHCLKTAGDTFEHESFEYPIVWNDFYPNIESTLEVSLGVYDRSKQVDRRVVKVARVIRHPSFDYQNLHNDIALLKLADFVRPSNTVQFACLTNSLTDVNLTGIAVGFGDTIPGANRGSLLLQKVNLTVYPNDYCADVSSTVVKNWTVQLCCGDLRGERDVCHGDSGGGLYVEQNISHTSRFTVAGIVSYGEQCATPMKPSIYTRVSNYIDWIRANSDFDAGEV